jgi:polygalacturonase
MLKIKVLLMAMVLTVAAAKAQYTALPNIPSAVYNINDFGALNDGHTLNTRAIQKALDAAANKGGTVLIPAGVYLCGPLSMAGKTNLELAKDAVLRLRNDVDDYPATNGRYGNFITVTKTADIKISGTGTIDGQGEIWWKKTDDNSLKYRRPQMLYIEGSQRIEISGVTFLNPPNTHISMKDVKDVYIHDIIIQAPANSHNTDGINISAKDCTIDHCTINTGDDNIAINFGNKQQSVNDPEVRNMVVRNCTFGYGHGLSIGSYTSGGLSDLHVSNCTFDGTTAAIRIKTARGRGGVIQHISYQDITIKNSRYPIFISEYYPKEPKTPQEDVVAVAGDREPVYKDILLKNIKVSNCQQGMLVWGVPESPIQHLRFENVSISAKKGAIIYNTLNAEFIGSEINAEAGEKLTIYNAGVTGLK